MSFNFGGTGGAGEKKAPFSFGQTATPTGGGTTNVFGNQASTTPAGPPPSNTGFSFGGGQASNSTSSGLFGAGNGNGNTGTSFNFGSSKSTTPATATPAPASSFSFGAKPTAAPNNAGTTATPAQSGGATPANFSFGGTAQSTTAKPASGFPLGAATIADNAAEKPAFSFGASTPAQAENKPQTSKPSFSFGANAQSATEKPAEKQGGFSFGTPATTSQVEKSAEKPSSFNFGGPSDASKTDKPSEKVGSFGMNAAADASKTDKASEKPTATNFGLGAPTSAATTDAKPTTDAKQSFAFGGATQGAADNKAPAAPAPAILKNKTLDELVTKWSQDLEKYTGAFQKQARQIAEWDQTLLSSGDAISRLYAATATAEQTSGKVDQALTYIEHQQDELEAMLGIYEAQVKEISNEVGVSQPVDIEREKAYGQAEKLITELDSMGRDLAGMMTEINKSADTMSQLKDSDALSTIVKTLNQHVESLSWIDENATLLSEKLEGLQVLEADKSRMPTQRSAFGSMRLT